MRSANLASLRRKEITPATVISAVTPREMRTWPPVGAVVPRTAKRTPLIAVAIGLIA
jgi:hypothetical protein